MPRTEQGTGWKGTETSHAAATRVNAAQQRQLVLDAFRAHDRPEGYTPDEIAALARLQPLQCRPRVTELHQAGELVHKGLTRPSDLGNTMRVYHLRPAQGDLDL